MGNSSSHSVAYHSNILIGDNVYVWGGNRPGIPLLHDSLQKKQFISSITVYNILQSSLDTRQTTGTPPNGTINYSSCCIGEDIYYFGGSCIGIGCYHNNLFVLNTKSYEWREIDCDDGPMKKRSCGMIPFCIDGEDYLLVVGGYGPIPAHDTPDHYKYTPHPDKPSLCYTNEVHIMCVSSTPGKWTVPMTTGSVFRPLARFSINTLQGNRAIVFGGVIVMNEQIRVRTNDVLILTYCATKNTLSIQKLVKPPDPSIQWPEGRYLHSSVIITSVSSIGRKHHLLVMGGKDDNNDVISDTWILSIDNMKWNKVVLPEVVSGRYAHSMTCFKMSMNCVWLVITGGFNSSQEPAKTNIIELVFSPSDDNWSLSVNVVMDEIFLKHKDQYVMLVSDRLVREKKHQLMMESIVPITTEPGLTGGGEEKVKLLKQQLKEKDEKTMKLLHDKDQVIMQREEIIRIKEELFQQKDAETTMILHNKDELIMGIIQRNDEIIRSKEELLQQKDQAIMERDEIIQRQKDDIRQNDDDIQLISTICQNDEEIGQTFEIENINHLQQKQGEMSDLQSQLESRPWVIQDEEVNVTNTIIGYGGFSEVRVAVFRGIRVAAKLLHELTVSRHNKHIFIREMEISSGIHHPNIVQFIGATRINNPILLYELMATSLHKRLQDDESLTHSQIVSIASNICTAMCYLHQWRPEPIIHRDISSPNVLMEPLPNDKWRAKLSDFGSANLQLHIKTIMPGSPTYAAPEARCPEDHSPAMDVYSFGVLLTEITLHRAPEMDRTKREQSARRINWIEMRVIVLKCINNYRSQRLSSEQLLTELQKL